MSSRKKVQDQTGRMWNGPDLLNGIQHWFRGAPTNSVSGFEAGCLGQDITNGDLYINAGTTSSSSWYKVCKKDTNGNQGAIKGTSLSIGASGSETLLAASIAELNRSSQVSTRLVTVAAATTTLTLTEALHEGRTVLVQSTAGLAITPTAATGSGDIYTIGVIATVTGGSVTIDFKAANASDVINGTGYQFKAGTGLSIYSAGTNTNLITLNGTTTGGIIGDIIQIQDVATHQWLIRLFSTQATGTVATPFSNH